MVAVLTVFANHLWGWPSGGFVGVDVFFVISGFLITGNLLRDAELRGTVSFRKFYWNRVRRIVPAATVVLILTYLAATLVFLPFRSHQVGVDALFAFVFLSNWWFAYQGTDYFRAAENSVSPLQHYWSLSIEEQFYFVWPALIFLISLIILRKGWSHAHRMRIAGFVMGAVIVASLGWALYETAASPAWAYFNTFARVWELGVGALLACAVGIFARIPFWARPLLSWAGLALIAVSLGLIGDSSPGFPAPWALLPVAGAALVIAAGVGEEPRYQGFLCNPVAGYIGDISYSLYLVHWPVIIIMGALMDGGVYYSLTTLGLAFGLAIASYHGVENPLRHIDREKVRTLVYDIRKRSFQFGGQTGYAAVGATILLAIGVIAFALNPTSTAPAKVPPTAVAAPAAVDPSGKEVALGPLTTELQKEIDAALQATQWPQLDPSLESVISGKLVTPALAGCVTNDVAPNAQYCLSGDKSASKRVVVVGDSMALAYGAALHELAINSNGQISVFNAGMGACTFMIDLIERDSMDPNCGARKQYAVDYINQTKPDVVIVANWYREAHIVGRSDTLYARDWSLSEKQIVDKFRGNVGKVVLLAAPPGGADIRECYSKRGSVPADCIGNITRVWSDLASSEKASADSTGSVWIDSRPWFCSSGSLCPAFAGTTPLKYDQAHMAAPAAKKIYPVMMEALQEAGVF
jgi:peptidoglycan/LPS O-acetylase OafA/YrhL